MKKVTQFILIMLLMGISFLVTTCKKSENEIPPSLNVNPTTKEIDQNTGNFNVSVTSTVAWTASCDKNWITLEPLSGIGNGTIKADFQANSSITPRTANIVLKGTNIEDHIISVTQSGIQPILTITPAMQNVSVAAGSTTINIVSNLSWSVSSDQTWCTLAQTSGTGNTALTVNYLANAITSPRTATITFTANGISSQTVLITQAELIPVLIVTPSSHSANSLAGTATYTITSNIPWTAACGESWLSISNPNGSNNATLTVNYEQNATIASRVASIVVSGNGIESQTVTLTQTNIVPTLTVTPANKDVASTAGSTTFDITSNTSWIAQSDQTWCTITSTAGTGNATLTVNYELNTTLSQRVGIITISGNGLSAKAVTVTQQSAISTEGIVAYYPFNGNANDESGKGHNGIVNGAALTKDRKGNINKAYNFNGISNNILAANGINGKTFSLSIWINIASADLSRHEIISFGDIATNQSFFLHIVDNKVSCDIANVQGMYTSNSCSVNGWHHCVVNSVNGLVSLYIDNTFRSSFNFSSMNISGTNFSIGSLWDNFQTFGYSWYSGSLDDIRIYNRALTDNEIKQLYNE